LKRIFKARILEAHEAYNAGDKVEMLQMRDQALRIYLFYLVGITLFTDKSARYVDVAYLEYFRDLELVSDYAWGLLALSHRYMKLNNASHYNTKHLLGYLSLF